MYFSFLQCAAVMLIVFSETVRPRRNWMKSLYLTVPFLVVITVFMLLGWTVTAGLSCLLLALASSVVSLTSDSLCRDVLILLHAAILASSLSFVVAGTSIPVIADAICGVSLMLFFLYSLIRICMGKTIVGNAAPVMAVPPGQEDDKVPDSVLAPIYERLEAYFAKEKPFLKRNMTASKIAAILYTNRTYLSKAVGRFHKNNFSHYSNGWRVRYAVEVFKQNPSYKVEELAIMSGFSSANRFAVAFNEEFGVNPREWMKCYRAGIKF